MTEQIDDTCRYDGRKWEIEESDGPKELDCFVPSSEELGFSTVMDPTANWSGRINHFLVHKDQLYLFKIEVCLPQKQREYCPPGVRRETRILYEPYRSTEDNLAKRLERKYEYLYFIYDDLRIEYSGRLILVYPCYEAWEYPWPLDDQGLEPQLETCLEFDEGLLTSIRQTDLRDA